jgi:nucleoside phosphorylase/ABC-type dipeptide/oligopeptide/nickel transport system ATPase subunit
MNASDEHSLTASQPLRRNPDNDLTDLLHLCRDPGQLFGLVYGGSRSGKTDLINQLLDRLPPGVEGLSIYLRNANGKSLRSVITYIVRQAYQLLAPTLNPPNQTTESLVEALDPVLQKATARVSVLVIHGLGAITKDVRWDLADQLCGVYHARHHRPAFMKLQIILCGDLELYDLAEKDLNSPLAGVCKPPIYISDLAEAEAMRLVNNALQEDGLPAEHAQKWAELVYQTAGGHRYLTQLFISHIQGLRVATTDNKRELVDHITEIILKQDRMFTALQATLIEYQLGAAVRRLVRKQARQDSQTEKLRVLGLVDDTGDIWLPRNRVFELALTNWFIEEQNPDHSTVSNNTTSKREHADVGIIVALPEEFRYLREIIATPLTPKGDDDTDVVFYHFTHGTYHCVATMAGDMGPGPVQFVTGRFLTNYQVKTLVLIGIAGSIDKEVLLGDIVVADSIIGWIENAKAVATDNLQELEFALGPEPYDSNDFSVKFQNFEFLHPEVFQRWQLDGSARYEHLKEIGFILRGQKKLRQAPRIIVGKIASGPVVVGSEAVKRKLKQHDRDTKAVEMEALGMMRGIKQYKKQFQPRALILRGISDFADERKSDLDEQTGNEIRRTAMLNTVALLLHALDLELL